uniref:Membrane protein of ER body-like protein isoform X1 n=1 Tax=Rhizophora mucronata TaxID=61149 RepID=A0A2P2J2V3_RHIMU
MEQQEQQQQQRQHSWSEETGALRMQATATATTGSNIFSVSDCESACGSTPDHILETETVLEEEKEEEGPPPTARSPDNSLYFDKQQLQDMDLKQQHQHQHQHPTLMVLEDEEEEEDVAFQLQGRKPRHGNNNHSGTVVISSGDGDSNGIDNSNINSKIANGAHGNSKDMLKDEGDSLHSSVYYDKEQVIGAKPGNVEIHERNFDTQISLTEKVNHKNGKIVANEGFLSSSLTPCIESFGEKDVESNTIDNEARLVGEFYVIEEIDQEGAIFDVEKVLEKQNTHDLYCPNCNSCITRRVILRRRKRKVRSARHKPKHDKFGTVIHSQLGSTSATNDQGHDTDNTVLSTSLALDDDNHGGEPDAFRCLSCFSIFIPTGNGFKFFRFFGGSTENENAQNRHRIPQSNTKGFFSMFTMDKKKAIIEQEDAHASLHQKVASSTNTECLKDEKSPVEIDLKFNLTVGTETQVDKIIPVSPIPSPLSESICIDTNDMGSSSKNAVRETTSSSTNGQKKENLSKGLGIISDLAIKNLNQGGDALHHSVVDSLQHEKGIRDSPTPLVNIVVDSGKDLENASLGPHPGGIDSLEASTCESLTLERSKIDVDKINDAEVGNDHSTYNGEASNIQGRPLATQLSSKGRSTNMSPINAIKDVLFCWIPRTPMPENGKPEVKDKAFDLIKDKNKDDVGNGVMLTVEAGELQQESSQSSQNVSVSVDERSLLESGTQAYIGEESSVGVSIDILKSIVYGGLIESITSLVVVTSAASAGATTLEILALGLANVIGGLFIILHNLIDLKNDPREASSPMNEQVDRYQEMLGRRENLLLHMTVVIISYLIFGLLPPVIYGYSLHISSNKDLKLAATGGASLACIILLAIGKAHVQRQPKSYLRTVLSYVILGLMASGASFVVGDLIGKFLQKVVLLESSSAVTTLTQSTKPAWASL